MAASVTLPLPMMAVSPGEAAPNGRAVVAEPISDAFQAALALAGGDGMVLAPEGGASAPAPATSISLAPPRTTPMPALAEPAPPAPAVALPEEVVAMDVADAGMDRPLPVAPPVPVPNSDASIALPEPVPDTPEPESGALPMPSPIDALPSSASDSAPAPVEGQTEEEADRTASPTRRPAKSEGNSHVAANPQTLAPPAALTVQPQRFAIEPGAPDAEPVNADIAQTVKAARKGPGAKASVVAESKADVPTAPSVSTVAVAAPQPPTSTVLPLGHGDGAPSTITATDHPAARQTVTADAAGAPADALPGGTALEPRVPAPLFTQTLEAVTQRHAALPYPSAPAEEATATVAMREGHFGRDVGVAIARVLGGGPEGVVRDAMLIRLEPQHMGRIDVKMSFDDDGTLRAVISADSPAALDMLRRESTHLDRALNDAGVRADAQSLRFDGNGAGGAGTGTGSQQRHGGMRHQPDPLPGSQSEFSGEEPAYRSLRGSGHVDLMA